MANKVRVVVVNPDVLKMAGATQDGVSKGLEKAKELVEGHFDNNPPGWMPLKRSTLMQRQRLGFGAGPILYRTGRLKGEAVQQIQLESTNSGSISTSDGIAVIQDQTRPIYELSDAEEEAIAEAFLDEFVKGW